MFIYQITNSVNGKAYVGFTSRTPEERFRVHVAHCAAGGKQHCSALWAAMKKHGVAKFRVETLEECSTKNWKNRERHWIRRLKTKSPSGYNLTDGGEGSFGFKHRPESIRKMSGWQLGRKLSDAHKRKVSESLKGNKRAMGMKHTAETKAKISAKFKGINRPPVSKRTRETQRRYHNNRPKGHRRNLAKALANRSGEWRNKCCQNLPHHQGNDHVSSKLREVYLPTIFRMRANGITQRAIGTHFGVTQGTIAHVLNGRTWKPHTALLIAYHSMRREYVPI